jgi:hypothetical protein
MREAPALAEGIQKLRAAHHGHHEIQQQQAWGRFHPLELFESFFAILRFQDIVASDAKHERHVLADVSIVLHDQDAFRVLGHSVRASRFSTAFAG